MPHLLHCGKRRPAFRRTDIRAPKTPIKYNGQLIQRPDELFESILLYEFHCPSCLHAKGMLEIFAWMGVYYSRKLGKSSLQKISPKELERWLVWRDERRLVENTKGVSTVQGSMSVWPYVFRNSISIR